MLVFHMRRWACSTALGFFVFLSIGVMPAWTDDRLDQMMREMNEKKMLKDDRSEQGSSQQAIYQRAQSILSSVSNLFRSVQAAQTQDEEDYDVALEAEDYSADTNQDFWQKARDSAQETRDVMQNFPVPNFYWTPGIAGDATNAIFEYADKKILNDDNQQ